MRRSIWSCAALLALAACKSAGGVAADDASLAADTGAADAEVTAADGTATAADAADAPSPDVAAEDGGDAAQAPAPWSPGKAWPNTASAAVKGPLSAGAASGFLDSPVGVSMAGYGARTAGTHATWSDILKGSRGFYGRMVIKALALQVGSERLVFVKSPLLTSDSYLSDGIANRLLAAYNLDLRGRIIMSATHSHHAPARFWPIPAQLGMVGLDTYDAELTARMVASFAATIKAAIDDLAPAEWAWSATENWDPADTVYRDRRDENDPLWGKDPRLTLLAVRHLGGPMLATILHFPVHGTAFGEDNDLLSEDAPGAVEHKVEEAWFAAHGTPLQAMFMQCAGGDASPAGDALGHATPARLEKLGETAAGYILPKLLALQWRAEAELAVRTVRLDINHAVMYAAPNLVHEFDGAEEKPYVWGGWQCKAEGVKDGKSMAGKPKLCIDLGLFLEALDVTLPFGELNQVLLTAARLDDLALITLPGEPTYSLVQYARQLVEGQTPGIASLMVVGYSQDYFLYLTAPEDWLLGGYESQMSVWGPGGGKYFADRVVALLQDVLAGHAAPTFWESSPTLALPDTYTPRPVEASEDLGAVIVDLPAAATRGQALDFAFGGGDPNLGPPTVTLQRQVAGAWTDVPARSGHKGAHYDNSRYEMITLYRPIPEVQPKILPSRKHDWRVRWQVPADLPLGTYRFFAQQAALTADGKTAALAVTSHAVQIAPGLTSFQAVRKGKQLVVTMLAQPVPYQAEKGYVWPAAGWRLIDRDVVPTQPGHVRAKLHLTFVGPTQTMAVDGAYDEASKGVVVDLAPLGLTSVAFDVTPEVAGSDGTGTPLHVAAP